MVSTQYQKKLFDTVGVLCYLKQCHIKPYLLIFLLYFLSKPIDFHLLLGNQRMLWAKGTSTVKKQQKYVNLQIIFSQSLEIEAYYLIHRKQIIWKF